MLVAPNVIRNYGFRPFTLLLNATLAALSGSEERELTGKSSRGILRGGLCRLQNTLQYRRRASPRDGRWPIGLITAKVTWMVDGRKSTRLLTRYLTEEPVGPRET